MEKFYTPDDIAHGVPALRQLRAETYQRSAQAAQDGDFGEADYLIVVFAGVNDCLAFAEESAAAQDRFVADFESAVTARLLTFADALARDADEDLDGTEPAAGSWWLDGVNAARAVSPWL